MKERCPCCNARLKGATKCPRCLADLSIIIDSEKLAETWLSEAIQKLKNNEIEQSIAAINQSLHLNRTKTGEVFYDFLVRQQCQDILDLLTRGQLILAKKMLYDARELIPQNIQLQQLDAFTNYLLVKEIPATQNSLGIIKGEVIKNFDLARNKVLEFTSSFK